MSLSGLSLGSEYWAIRVEVNRGTPPSFLSQTFSSVAQDQIDLAGDGLSLMVTKIWKISIKEVN